MQNSPYSSVHISMAGIELPRLDFGSADLTSGSTLGGRRLDNGQGDSRNSSPDRLDDPTVDHFTGYVPLPPQASQPTLKHSSVVQLLPTQSRNTVQNEPEKTQGRLKSRRSRFWKQLARLWNRSCNTWIWSCFSLALGFVSIGAIVVVLAIHDGSSVPSWKFGITLNALVSVLATIGASAIAGSVAAAVGQMKWNHFRRETSLIDFETIDQASRGPAGSLMLLVKRRGGIVPALGAVLLITILAINPFVQQLVSLRSETVDSGSASLPLTISYEIDREDGNPVTQPDLSVKSAMYNGLFNGNATNFNVTSTCPTGNCTWPAYQTLGICCTCANITSYVKRVTTMYGNETDPYNSNVSLPNGLVSDTFIDYSPTYEAPPFSRMVMSNTWQNLSALVFKDNGSILLDMFALHWSGAAVECMLQYCVKTYNASSINGTFKEIELDRWTNNSIGARESGSANDTVFFGYDIEAVIYLTPPEQATTYAIGPYFQKQMIVWMGTLFNGFVSSIGYSDQMLYSDTSRDTTQAVWQAMDSGPFTEFYSVMESVAASLTLSMRSAPNSDASATGVATVNETVVHIKWVWIILPLAVPLLSLLFLLIVMFDTRRRRLQIWRNHSLATLFHGLEEESRRKLGTLYEVDGMEEVGEHLKAVLDVTEYGWQLRSRTGDSSHMHDR